MAIGCPLPGLTVDLYDAFASGDWKRAAELQRFLTPLALAVTSQFGIPGLKAAMDLVGFHGGEPRAPLLPLQEKARATLKSLFQAAGVLEVTQRV